MSVAKLWDDLWLGVISQSNLVIAGSLRNILKYGGLVLSLGVGRFLAQGSPRPLQASNTRLRAAYSDVNAQRCYVERETAQTVA